MNRADIEKVSATCEPPIPGLRRRCNGNRDGDHDLFDVFFLSVCATIAGADGPSDIEDFGHDQLSWIREEYVSEP